MTAEGRTYYGFGEENRIVGGRPAEDRVDRRRADRRDRRRTSFSSRAAAGPCEAMPTRTSALFRQTAIVSGGRSLIEGSAELRARVTDTIGVVAFADAGYVGAELVPGFLGRAQGGRRRRPALSHRARSDPAGRSGSALDPSPDDPTVGFLRWNRTSVLTRFVLAIALLFFALPALAQDARADAERSYFVSYVEGQLSTPNRQIRINGIQGVLVVQCHHRRDHDRRPAKGSGCA